MEEESSSEGEDDHVEKPPVIQKHIDKRSQPAPLPPIPDKVIVKKGYDPKQSKLF
jgi:hypothetical protein